MIVSIVRKSLIEYYEKLIAKGALVYINVLQQIENVSDEELLNIIKYQHQNPDYDFDVPVENLGAQEKSCRK